MLPLVICLALIQESRAIADNPRDVCASVPRILYDQRDFTEDTCCNYDRSSIDGKAPRPPPPLPQTGMMLTPGCHQST